MNGSLKKGILEILIANIINMVFNLLTNFLLPKYLSIDSYAAIKTFQLYSSYVGIFALGYSDGMYLRYGGREIGNIDQEELKSGMSSFKVMMLCESFLLIPLSFIFGSKIAFSFSLSIMASNMISYYKNLYQAVGEFDRYSKILNWTTVLTFLANMGLLFVIKTDNYLIYLISYVIIYYLIWMSLEFNTHKILGSVKSGKISFLILLEDIKNGFPLMIGNFSNILLSSMDRWFVKIMMDASQFAYYSFAVSMEGFLNVAVTPITTTLYNYFCNHSNKNDVVRIRRYILIFGSVIVALAFPARFVIDIFLSKYKETIDVLFILFASQMVYIIIKGVYVNLYKASGKQNLYFLRLVLILIIGALLNWAFVKVYPHKEAFSYGTLVSAYIWLVFSINDFRDYIFEPREWVYLIAETITFIISGINFNAVLGFLIYIGTSFIFMNLFLKYEKKEVFNILKNEFRIFRN